MLILGLLGMYIDAVVVFFTISSLFFRMAMAVLWAPILQGVLSLHEFWAREKLVQAEFLLVRYLACTNFLQ